MNFVFCLLVLLCIVLFLLLVCDVVVGKKDYVYFCKNIEEVKLVFD